MQNCRGRHSQLFFTTGVLKNYQISQENTCVGISFYKSCMPLEKETPTQVLLCEICEIFNDTLFNRTPPVATFEI